MLEIGMEFDLVDRRRDLCGLQRRLQMRLEVVGDPNGLHLARLLQLFHLRPGIL